MLLSLRPGRRFGAAGLAVVLLAASPAHGQAPGAPAQPAAAPAPTTGRDSAAVVVKHRFVTVLRAPLGVLSAGDRAAAAARRIELLADSLADVADDSLHAAVAAVAVRPSPHGLVLAVGARGVLTLTPADVDTLAGETLEALGAGASERLREVLRAEREERSIAHLLRALGLAVAATLVFLLVLRLLVVARRWLVARLLTTRPAAGPAAAAPDESGAAPPARARRRLPALSLAGVTLLGADQLRAFGRRLVDVVTWTAGLFAGYVWLAFVLTRFAYSRPWGEALGAYLRATLGDLALSALSGVPGLFTVVVIVVATRWVARLVGTFFDAVQAGTVQPPWIYPETANATKRIAMILLWLFAVVVAYPYVPGSGSDVFKGISVFAGLVLSLGSSGIVNQAMSGLVLVYARALGIGDYVRIGEVEGTVTSLGILSTKIRTTKREEVTLPNAVVVSASVKNYSRLCAAGEGVIVHTGVTIGYDVPWRQVEALLLEGAARTAGLLREPRPFVLKTGLSDFYVEYQLNAHLGEAHRRIPVLSELHAHIVDAFNEHGVQILSPHYVADPPSPAVVPRERWWARPAARADGAGPA